MRSSISKKSKRNQRDELQWLPIDSRLLPHLFSFGHVKGIAKIFIQLEIVLSMLVVFGTFLVVVMKLTGVYNK